MNDTITILAVGGAIALAIALVLMRKLPFQLIGAVLRVMTLPLRLLLRVFGVTGRSGRAVTRDMTPSAFAATARAFRRRTDTEVALGEDFDHERGFITTSGLIFRWMGVRVGFMRMPEEMTDALAEEYAALGESFLGAQVPIGSDPRSLFEDVEGAVLASLFHDSDRGILFLLNESRKMINANVRKLTVWFSGILSAVLIVNLIYNNGAIIDFAAMMGLSTELPVSAAAINSLGFALVSCAGGALLMWALYFTEYAPFQRNNTREMANYLTRYLARVNDHYRTAVGKGKSVTVGEERDTKVLAAKAQKWHVVIVWLAFRVFFIESYVRNSVFQITRNSSYYLIFVPAIFLGVLIGVFAGLGSAGVFDPVTRIVELGWVFAALFVLVVAIYALFLLNAMDSLKEIDQGEWISFHTLRLNAVMGDIVGKYAEDVGYWKNRVGGNI